MTKGYLSLFVTLLLASMLVGCVAIEASMCAQQWARNAAPNVIVIKKEG